MHFAGSLARVLGAEMHALYALGLAYRPLRSVMHALSDLPGTISAAARTLVAQVERTVAAGIVVPPPLVELDDTDSVVRRYVEKIEPMAIIASHLWEPAGPRSKRAPRAFTQSMHAPPVIIVRGARRPVYDRVVLISAIETFNSETIEAAGRWGFWLEQVYGCGSTSGPAFEVVLVDEATPLLTAVDRITHPHADLIAVDRSVFGQPDIAPDVEQALSIIAAKTDVPIALIGGVRARESIELRANVTLPATPA